MLTVPVLHSTKLEHSLLHQWQSGWRYEQPPICPTGNSITEQVRVTGKWKLDDVFAPWVACLLSTA